MRESQSFENENEETGTFPSLRTIVGLYVAGAVLSLAMVLTAELDSLHTANCLILAWLFTMGALAMATIGEESSSSESQ